MNGAESLIRTLVANDVTVCFANPGTSEMQFVAALDSEKGMRSVLCLFEGVATGAADGYGRMAGKPACTLLHLGPGYANGGANLHNAKRARTPLVNIIGDHATYHRLLDAPLNSDIKAWTIPNAIWTRSAETADTVGLLVAHAIHASKSRPRGVADLILPADAAWDLTDKTGPTLPSPERRAPERHFILDAARALKVARQPVILLSGSATSARGLAAASRIATLGVRIMTDTFVARQTRGAGLFRPDRMMYLAEAAVQDLEGVDIILTVETGAPVAFFAYPDKPSRFAPEGCIVQSLCEKDDDGIMALEELANLLGAPLAGAVAELDLPDAPEGKLTPGAVGSSIARHLPEDAVISDDAVTSGIPVFLATQSARRHDWLMLTGGGIGQGIPVSIGAAIACPERKVVSLNGDGAAMFTLQGLWTIARENLDVVTVIFANRAYRVLEAEMFRTGGGQAGPSAARLLSLSAPDLDWCALASGMGMSATRCDTAESFEEIFAEAMSQKGPQLIEAII
jgi:acetolactate synthase I/II/III large subunit